MRSTLLHRIAHAPVPGDHTRLLIRASVATRHTHLPCTRQASQQCGFRSPAQNHKITSLLNHTSIIQDPPPHPPHLAHSVKDTHKQTRTQSPLAHPSSSQPPPSLQILQAGGPNLEVFKFGLYILFPIAIMYYYGTNLEGRFSTPDFWPRPEQTNRVPFEREEIKGELERLRERRLWLRERRLREGGGVGVDREDSGDAGDAGDGGSGEA